MKVTSREPKLPLRKMNKALLGKTKVTIGKKLFLGFFAVLFFLLATAAFSYSQIATVDHAYSNLIKDEAKTLTSIQELTVATRQEQAELFRFVIVGDQSALDGFSKSHDKFLQLSSEIEQMVTEAEAGDILKSLIQIEEEFYQFSKQATQLKRQSKIKEYTEAVAGQGREIIKRFDEKADKITSLHQEFLEKGINETSARVSSVKIWVVALGISALLLGVFIAYYIGRVISGPVIAMAKAAEKIAAGDLSMNELKINNNDEIGDLAASFNQMTLNLRNLISQVGSSTGQVAVSAEQLTASAEQNSNATEQIAATIHDVAVGVDKQVESIQETSQTFNEISDGIQQIAHTSQMVSNTAFHASGKAAEGGQAIATVIEQMNSINNTVRGLSEVIIGLGSRSKEVDNITRVITDLAAQTNLLALNAAIEAARAGVHGAGFAVVADEVRKLAEQSARSAGHISHLVSAIQEETDKAIETTEITAKEVLSGIKVVNKAGESFQLIENSVNEVAAQIQGVTSSVQKIADGAEQVAESVNIITGIAESTAAGTQEVSAATEEQTASMEEISTSANQLSRMAEELKLLIGKFKVQ